MNLWLVGNRQYVISDGPAGAAYLANAISSEEVTLIKRNVEKDFKPRLISQEEAKQLIGDEK